MPYCARPKPETEEEARRYAAFDRMDSRVGWLCIGIYALATVVVILGVMFHPSGF